MESNCDALSPAIQEKRSHWKFRFKYSLFFIFYIYLFILPGEERKMHSKMSMHQIQGAETAILTFYSVVTSA